MPVVTELPGIVTLTNCLLTPIWGRFAAAFHPRARRGAEDRQVRTIEPGVTRAGRRSQFATKEPPNGGLRGSNP